MPTFPQFSPSFDPAAARQLGDEVLQLLVDAEEERFEGLEALFVPRHQARGRPAEMDGMMGSCTLVYRRFQSEWNYGVLCFLGVSSSIQ